MTIDIIRRSAERGLKQAQERSAPPPFPEYELWEDQKYRAGNAAYIDIFQHILDELERLDDDRR